MNGRRGLKTAFVAAAPAARWVVRPGRLSILIYHRVFPATDVLRPGEVTADGFALQLRLLAKHCNVLSLREANQARLEGRLPPRAVCITFDDGYRDNLDTALPILQTLGLPATVFVASHFSGGGRMWNDDVIEAVRIMRPEHMADMARFLRLSPGNAEQRFGKLESMADRCAMLDGVLEAFKYLPLQERITKSAKFAALVGVPAGKALMMDAQQLRALAAAGVEIGGHTVNHPILAALPADEALREITENKRWLESTIGQPVTSFAYPNGKPGRDYSPETVALVKRAGYQLAVTTAKGVSHQQSDALQLPRFTPWDQNPEKFLLRLLLNTWQRGYDQVAA